MDVKDKDKVNLFLYDYMNLCWAYGMALDDGDTSTLTVRDLPSYKRLCEVDFDFRMGYEINED